MIVLCQYLLPHACLKNIIIMQNTNVVVVGQQTAAPVVIETNSVGDHFLTLSVIMLILSVCCGTIFLVCTIPAVLLASSVRHYLFCCPDLHCNLS